MNTRDEPDNGALLFDVIIIGAGINGSGIARDAAMRGLSLLLLDKGDVGSGTSSWSTRLIHGGLRYLEHGEFSLVRESLRERECLLHIAPHLVRPLRMSVPIYKGARRGLWTMRAGMLAYDFLSFDKQLPRHRMLSRSETLAQFPGLNPNGLVGAAVYYDAQVEFAERLVIENALSAVAHGATVTTYARVDKLHVDGGAVRAIEFRDELPGRSPTLGSPAGQPDWGGTVREGSNGERQSASARIVINAAGPWVDELLLNSVPSSERLIGGTKGSHIIVGAFPGAPARALYVEAETDTRPFFIIPWNSHYLIGTTDIRYTGALDHIQIGDDEIDYLLRETNRVIPSAGLTRKEILYTYSGVRPLPFTGGGDSGNRGHRGDSDASSITRRHFIRPHPNLDNLFSIVGGKLTTYRSLAEETVNLIFKKLGRTRERGHPARNEGGSLCTTAKVPLPGAETPDFEAFSKDFQQRCGLSELTSDHLLRTYGTRSAELLKLVEDDPLLGEVFDAETGAIAAEVVFAFNNELAQTLADCLLRRTMVGLNSTCGLAAVEAAAKIAQTHLDWSDSRAIQETEAYRQEISRRFRG
ncbi:MAG: glycerol-3-phosphate dehydrogenase/oxidase [Pyrinomonadaceae bacterium]|nr:glycerol-3-phosphate dehydrogenase/oxidase [Pyrinomonadaceae bacterium]